MKLFALFFSLLFSFSSYAHHCARGDIQFETVHGCIEFKYTEGPYINERGQRQLSAGIVRIYDLEDDVNLDNIFFYTWMKMPNMEHGGRPVSVRRLDHERFLIENILLNKMSGQWFLRINLNSIIPHHPTTDYDGEFALTDWML